MAERDCSPAMHNVHCTMYIVHQAMHKTLKIEINWVSSSDCQLDFILKQFSSWSPNIKARRKQTCKCQFCKWLNSLCVQQNTHIEESHFKSVGNLGQHNFNFALSFFARTSSFATNPYIKGLELKGGFGFSTTQYPACKKLEHELFPLQRANNIPFSSVTFYRTPFFCIHCVKTIKLLLSLSQIF